MSRHYYKSESQPFKPKYVDVKDCYSLERCATYAELMFGLKNIGGYRVQCSVDGFVSNTGYLWTPNTLTRFVVDYLGINENMWIFGRAFRCDASQGQTTSLTLMPVGALVLGKIPQ